MHMKKFSCPAHHHIYVPRTLRVGGYFVFGADPDGVSVCVGVGIHFFVSVHNLMNPLMYFSQTYIDTLLGEGKS